ncbi:MAG: hypothetical protein OQL19_08850 [Gammaproteobacteria bacterium]|nr:hypothetical protein [Gammaproteobacteria bacterium]
MNQKFHIFLQIVILYFTDFIFKFINLKKYTFIIGSKEMANNIFLLKSIFSKDSLSINLTPHRFYSNSYDYSIKNNNYLKRYFMNNFYRPYLLAKLSNQSRVFIYFWFTGFCYSREIDYKFLKYKNIKIVCIFIGTDIRSEKLTESHYKRLQLDHYIFYLSENNLNNENRVKLVADLANSYADLTICSSLQKSYIKNNVDNFMYILRDNMFIKKTKINKTIKILHAPSNPIRKGTPLVRSAIKKLECEGYIFEYIEIIGEPNEVVLSCLEESDIVLNSFYGVLPGLFGIEAMSKSNAVLMSAQLNCLPNINPKAWIPTQYWEIYDNLKYLLDNPQKIIDYAKNGYDFVEKNYTEKKAREFYLNTFLEHKIIDKKTYIKLSER